MEYKIQLEKSDCYFLVSVDGHDFGFIASTKDGWKCTPKSGLSEVSSELISRIEDILRLLNSPTRMGY